MSAARTKFPVNQGNSAIALIAEILSLWPVWKYFESPRTCLQSLATGKPFACCQTSLSPPKYLYLSRKQFVFLCNLTIIVYNPFPPLI
ncbi:hypothetical protein CW304_18035 [Bacillus sp. UFRGS-B20]|nr:hypothetical protein CW304_18035 [Bacillus sp. UFRGS-B20]